MGCSCSEPCPANGKLVKDSPGDLEVSDLKPLVKRPGTRDTLLVDGHYGCKCMVRLRLAARDAGNVRDLIMIGDFGLDLDDEKALCCAVAMQRIGLVGKLTVVANTGNATLRARLAMGMLNVVGAADVRVAAGSHSTQEQQGIVCETQEFMFGVWACLPPLERAVCTLEFAPLRHEGCAACVSMCLSCSSVFLVLPSPRAARQRLVLLEMHDASRCGIRPLAASANCIIRQPNSQHSQSKRGHKPTNTVGDVRASLAVPIFFF